MKTLYCCSITEYEEGWGSRPDGYYLSTSMEELKKYIQLYGNSGEYAMFWRCGTPYEVFVEECEAVEKLVETIETPKQEIDENGVQYNVQNGRGAMKVLWVRHLEDIGIEFFKK